MIANLIHDLEFIGEVGVLAAVILAWPIRVTRQEERKLRNQSNTQSKES